MAELQLSHLSRAVVATFSGLFLPRLRALYRRSAERAGGRRAGARVDELGLLGHRVLLGRHSQRRDARTCGRANATSVEPCSFLLVLTPCHRSRRRRYEMMEKRSRTGWPPVRGKALQGMLLAGVGGPSVSVYRCAARTQDFAGSGYDVRGRQQHERAETYLSPH